MARIGGSSSRSTASSALHEPFSFATSIAAIPAGASSPSRWSRTFLVRRRPGAPRLARREELQAAPLVEPVHRAVDPAEAERLLDGLLVAQARPVARLLVEDEPDRVALLVPLGEPPPPRGAIRTSTISRPSTCRSETAYAGASAGRMATSRAVAQILVTSATVAARPHRARSSQSPRSRVGGRKSSAECSPGTTLQRDLSHCRLAPRRGEAPSLAAHTPSLVPGVDHEAPDVEDARRDHGRPSRIPRGRLRTPMARNHALRLEVGLRDGLGVGRDVRRLLLCHAQVTTSRTLSFVTSTKRDRLALKHARTRGLAGRRVRGDRNALRVKAAAKTACRASATVASRSKNLPGLFAKSA